MAPRRFTITCPLCGKRTAVANKFDAEFIEENGCGECNEGSYEGKFAASER